MEVLVFVMEAVVVAVELEKEEFVDVVLDLGVVDDVVVDVLVEVVVSVLDVVEDVVVVLVLVTDVVEVELHFGRLFVVPRLRERKKTFSGTIFAKNRNFV